MRRRHLPGLDGLRGVAVLLVLIYHAMPSRLPGGFVGVDVFFVLSGFLITALLLDETREHGRVRLRSFWMRRIRRLAPAMVAMLVVVSAATIVVGRDTSAGLRSQVAGALTWTSNWVQIHHDWSYSDQHLPPLLNHLWSLGIEEQFYLLWPLMIVAALATLGRHRTYRLAIAFALASGAVMATWYLAGDPNRAYMGLDSHSFGLLLGAALALSRFRHQLTSPGAADSSRRLTILGGLGLAAIVAFSVLVEWDSDVTFLGGLGLVNVAAVLVILAAVNPTPVAAALSWLPLRWLGERSYGLYLWHWPLIVFAVRLGPPDRTEWVGGLAVAVALGVAALSYRFVEVPMRRDGIGATLRNWTGALRDRRGVRRRSLAMAMTVLLAVFAGAALWQAPNESEVESALRAGQEVAVDSADDLDPIPKQETAPAPDVQPPAEPVRACVEVPGEAPLSVFGDSVTVAISPALVERRPGTAAVAAVGWQYNDVAHAVRQVAAAGQLQQTVLIATGTNGVIDPVDLDALVTNELAGRQVGLVVPSVPGRYWADQATQTVQAVAAMHDHVHLVDWNALVAQQPDVTTADRVHPSVHGQHMFVDLIDGALAQC